MGNVAEYLRASPNNAITVFIDMLESSLLAV